MEALDAIDLAVPDLARTDHAFDDASLPIQASDAPGGVEQALIGVVAPHRARIGILAGAAVRARQVEGVPIRQITAFAARAISGLERAKVDGIDSENDVEDLEIGFVPAGGTLVDDRRGMIVIRGERGGRGSVRHAFERLRDHHGIAVDGAAPERPPEDLFLPPVLERAR